MCFILVSYLLKLFVFWQDSCNVVFESKLEQNHRSVYILRRLMLMFILQSTFEQKHLSLVNVNSTLLIEERNDVSISNNVSSVSWHSKRWQRDIPQKTASTLKKCQKNICHWMSDVYKIKIFYKIKFFVPWQILGMSVSKNAWKKIQQICT